MRKFATGVLGIGLLFASQLPCVAEQSAFAIAVANIFRNAIVKIDVSAPNIVFKTNERGENVNICKSEGTGFLISSNHLFTAEHVYQLAAECGPPNIVVKAKKYNIQKVATVVAAKDDVALLKVDTNFPSGMCALALMSHDVYGVEAIRFGIPGGWDQPGPPAGVTIDQSNGQFAPLTLLAPVITEQGESGGPIIYIFNVVGMTRARHLQYKGYSFMTGVSAIRSLMTAIPIQPLDNICNPVKLEMSTNLVPAGSGGFPSLGGLLGRSTFSGRVAGLIKVDTKLTSDSSAGQILSGIKRNVGDSLSTLVSDNSLSVQGTFNSAVEYSKVFGQATQVAGEISQEIAEKLWKQYVEEGKKSGMWTDAAASKPPAAK